VRVSGTLLSLVFLFAASAAAQPKRVLYLTHSAGFRHDSIPASVQAVTQAVNATGKLQIVHSEDVSLLNATSLSGFDAVFFFTSGELPISDSQKRDLLEFVRAGKGFGGAHSATDTFYTWPEYGDLIGARFNGHPWTQSVTLETEDPGDPAVAHLAPAWTILDEIYQFREFSRDRVRVLLTLDTHSVDLGAPGVNPGTEDFPLAWRRTYGSGRVFYTALGHFDSTWQDARFSAMIREALLWLTGQTSADASPRPPKPPLLTADAIVNAASFRPAGTISPGSLISLFGANLTPGSTLAADPRNPAYKLAGATVKINGTFVPLLYASPQQINAYVPLDLVPRAFTLQSSAAGGVATVTVATAESTPGVFAYTTTREAVTIWATGLGPVRSDGGFQLTATKPAVALGGVDVPILFSGLAPGWFGLYQVNAGIPAGTVFPATLEFRFGPYATNVVLRQVP